MGRFSSYSGLNFAVRPSSSLSTACATATPPSPPFSHTSHSSTPTPSAAHSSRTASSSASPSFTNRLSATTTGTPNFCTFLMWRRAFAAPRRVDVGLAEVLLLHATVHFQRPHAGDDDRRLGVQAGGAALDVEELL